MKTIKQVADELGVSKEKVRYQVRNLPGNYRVKAGNVIYLNDEGIAEIWALLGDEGCGNDCGKPRKNRGNSAEIPHLEKMLQMLETELERKNQTISELTNALAVSQALHAGTMKKLTDIETVNENVNDKPGLLARMFGHFPRRK